MYMLNSAYDCIPNCYHQSQFHVVASITAVFLLCEEAFFAVACCLAYWSVTNVWIVRWNAAVHAWNYTL